MGKEGAAQYYVQDEGTGLRRFNKYLLVLNVVLTLMLSAMALACGANFLARRNVLDDGYQGLVTTLQAGEGSLCVPCTSDDQCTLSDNMQVSMTRLLGYTVSGLTCRNNQCSPQTLKGLPDPCQDILSLSESMGSVASRKLLNKGHPGARRTKKYHRGDYKRYILNRGLNTLHMRTGHNYLAVHAREENDDTEQ